MSAPEPPALFRKLLSSPSTPPVVVLAGDASALAGSLAELLAERFRGRGETAEISFLTPLDTEKGLPLEEWGTPDFFVRHRVCVLPEEGDLRKEAKADLAAWAAAPGDGVTLVAPAAKREGHKVLRTLPSVAVVQAKGGREVSDAIAAAAVRHASLAGVSLSPAGASFLVEWVGAEMGRVLEEVEKVVLIAGKGGRAGEAEVRQVCVSGSGGDPFRVARAVLDGNRLAFLDAFRKYAEGAGTDDYHSLAGAIAWEFRSRGKGRGPALSPEAGERVARALWEIDEGLKGGSGLAPGQLLEIRLLSTFR